MKLPIAILLCSQAASAFVYSQTWEGRNIRWKATGEKILYVDPRDINSPNIDSREVAEAVENGIDRWNQAAPVSFKTAYTDSPPPLGSSATLRFSSNPAYFGSGVLAVTSVSYNSGSGAIYGADILINDTELASASFTSDPAYSSGRYAYLGDVITHELGHLLGLNHSEVTGAAMVYSIFKDQHLLRPDDMNGVAELYGVSKPTGFSGTVAGEGGIPIFGAHVQAIDLEENIVASGVYSDEKGNFRIGNLSPKKSYALLVSPIRSKENLPKKFSTFRSDFCEGKSFQPTLFSKCSEASKGSAQVIQAEEGVMADLGLVTVRCSTSVDPNYLKAKLKGFQDRHVAWSYYQEYKGHAVFTGYFSQKEIEEANADKLLVDLSGLDPSASGGRRVDFSFSTEKLASPIGLAVYAKRVDESSPSFFSMTTSPLSGRKNLDFAFSLELSSDADQNVFEIDVYPQSLSTIEQKEIFASPEKLSNGQNLYLMSAVVRGNDVTRSIQPWNDAPYEDNSSCLETKPISSTTAYEPASPAQTAASEGQGISCATISDAGRGGGGGMGSFMLGLVLTFLVVALRGRKTESFV